MRENSSARGKKALLLKHMGEGEEAVGRLGIGGAVMPELPGAREAAEGFAAASLQELQHL